MKTTSEQRLLAEAVNRLLSSACSPPPTAQVDAFTRTRLWEQLSEMGLPWLGIPEELGGSGGSIRDAALAVRLAGAHSLPLPVAETSLLGGWATRDWGLRLDGAAVTVAVTPHGPPLTADRADSELAVSGVMLDVPFAADADLILVACLVDGGECLAALSVTDLDVTPGTNLAGEDRSLLIARGAHVAADRWRPCPDAHAQLLARAAAVRVLAMAAAAERILSMTITHTAQREQFDRPLSSFQAVQHHLAALAGATTALQSAAHLAERSLDTGEVHLAAAAKVVASEAAGTACAVAHQLHGAIGLTKEHSLHWSTHRLLSWRDEFGSELYWSRVVGRRLTERAVEPWHALVPA
jgi:acyl-CoA dehydrogenase